MQVRALMTENPATCTPDTNLEQVAQMLVECDCGAIPVVADTDQRKPVGVVTDRDIVTRIVAKGQNPLQKRAADAMTDAVVSVRPEDTAQRCAELMEEHQVRRLVVVDDSGAAIGIVAQADLARHASDETAGEVVEEVSEPTRKASQPSA